MYHVVASDLDGTLLSPAHSLTPYTKETLRLLTINKGVHFVFATGRHHVDVAQIRDALGIDAFMITSNGARVHNTKGELVFSHDVDPDVVRELCLMEFDNPDILTNYYRGDGWMINRESPEQKEFFQESVFMYELFDRNDFPVDQVCKVYFTCDDHEKLVALEAKIRVRFGNRVNVSFSLRSCLEVMAGGVSKGEALQQVAESLGYRLNDCIAFGDGMNDREMLEMAGKGCIMAGAHQRLKDILPEMEVIGSNADDAVAHYLRRLYQQ
ncbi:MULTISPECIES: sugar/pyridoxal phosphate phosphatase YigL [Morganella]|uniref:Sugar/pyridoxal phosphate phosphatase YigL n=2 Tax=Enterobacterales TaxID=91347 RepID=A0A9Q4GSL0_MORMO|nr:MULTISPECIES: sugar/pyridoxal phosphate phosphatase YigL [Morganella]HAE78757.1 sugar/pyridoxal phosphate phosphatase YigL [Morganella sp. (in: enterobacteria)]EGT3621598.1 sugar/pyridoxal phosphate phosphatase YigL [Morganella morganii]EGT3631185.1 sugar/pyridoxal phosphate phosphatase YigL [Morganella morganii]EGT3634231.1 sugar/pyridoxal phosphate phosphatase YigL [Morganella morganii]EJD6036862.1 sugar/pyridoxal phosphate phosphatase YigL [Morganella morganii]